MTPEIHDGDSLYKAEGVPIMDRILDVGGYGDKVRLDAGRITVQRRDGTSTFVPLDDVAVLMLSEQGSSVSVAVLAELAKHDATAVVCDRSHIPVGIYQPIAAHTRQTGILRRQIAVRPLLCARLWQRIVRAKINAQAQALARYGRRDAELEALAKDVRRGDAQNAEGHAALRYWRRLGLFECRDRFAHDANMPLNYAYAVLHGSTVRALCCAGLNTSLGINHCGPANPHCLASDLMEPFRPVADCAVRDWLTANPDTFELTSKCKRHLLGTLLSSRWRTRQGVMPFFLALSRAAVSLRDCLLGNTVELDVPTQVFEEDKDVDPCAV